MHLRMFVVCAMLILQKSAFGQTPPASENIAAVEAELEKAVARNDAARMRAVLEEGLARSPSWKTGLWRLGVLLYQQGEYADARGRLRRKSHPPRLRRLFQTVAGFMGMMATL